MSTKLEKLEIRCLSSLEKVFADEQLKAKAYHRGSALANEMFSFQMAYRSKLLLKWIDIKVDSELEEVVTVRSVGLVPAEMVAYHDHDDYILRSTPGLFPDPLYELPEEGLAGLPGHWRSLWITVDLQGKVKSGIYPIRISFEHSGECLAEGTFELEVIGAELPEQQLKYTNWFHTDCLATYYSYPVFSEEHWKVIENFMETAAKHGMNMILTPLFTPPLDTKVGEERPTVQLVDVEKTGDTYRFAFDKLKRWIELSTTHGIRYFEFSHLFTQWGAEHAPKIVATVNGESRRIFGWETDAAGDDYRVFLSQFLPELVRFIKDNQLEDRSYFHVSDEPHKKHLESYQRASDLLKQYLSDFPMIDALSDYDFYEKGYVKNPIPASNHIEPFLDNKVPNLWTYYCCSQYKEVANRFLNMPSARNRILGYQLYKYDIAGFLHWGYNFWYAQYSIKPIDPYTNTDSNYGFPAGDAFVVYPGKGGQVVESLRLKVFYDAFQDLRALQLLESLIGKEEVMKLVEDGLEKEMTFREYPRDSDWLLNKREQINQTIKEYLSKQPD
ncbi:DUF4091 domain-containing protein [Paenibacillus sp. J2TS4]|uniref:DUF4091 domain-containing protein n=1 Tax=Paenibacillus sp. J2TS4 TaxID=2807194 RepID=UPI001B0B5929|nr:DUF4091 domain-containing protein [Paenibacillus sp. J2TS4]GIP32191.1 hypothetical protein J2TS4_14010 [Paenibacillus sp. J2TS4]